jgi:PAS domain S-box-containing protein
VTPDSSVRADGSAADDLFEDAPCGFLTMTPDGTIVRVNRTFEQWTGLRRDELLRRRFPDLLSAGGRIYHETHYAPLLRMQGWVREIAVDVRRADGTLLPALINSVLVPDADGRPSLIRTIVFDATDRRGYEQELLRSRGRERAIAHELERSLLAGEPPVDPRIELDVAYHPATLGLEVGGDWFDAFWLRSGRELAVVVGDVVGHGIASATTMGQLRSAARALAGVGLGPARLLEALDGYVRRHDVGLMATVAYAQLDLQTGVLRYACAGHPPPAIVAPGADPRFAWDGRSAPLAAVADGQARTDAELALEPGSLLLLFTDGLFERRDRPLDDGLEQLLRLAAACRNDALGEVTRALVADMVDDRRRDDVCLLALRLRAIGDAGVSAR